MQISRTSCIPLPILFISQNIDKLHKSPQSLTGQAKNESDLARKVGMSRVRIWQYTSLLGLNASLVKAVEALGDPMPKRLITERQLRQMLKHPKEQESFVTQLQKSNY